MDDAVTPTSFSDVFTKVKSEQEKLIDSLQEQDQVWVTLADNPAYGRLKEFILSLIDGLDELEGKAMENGARLEEIGMRRLVNRLTKVNLMSVINKVEKTAEYIKSRGASTS